MFFLGFLPALWQWDGSCSPPARPARAARDVGGWSEDAGILGGRREDSSLFRAGLAFGLGLVFAFSSTRRVRAGAVERETVVPDEDIHDYDRTVVTPASERTVVREDETLPGGTTRRDVS